MDARKRRRDTEALDAPPGREHEAGLALDADRPRSLFPFRARASRTLPPSQSDMLISLLLLLALSSLGISIANALGRRGGRSDKEIEELRERVLRLEQSIESMTGDMDRVSESQRFMTALLEDRARSQGALKPPTHGDQKT